MKLTHQLKFVLMAMTVIFSLETFSQNASAQNNQLTKKQEKGITKKAKKEAKTLTKEGWEISGSSQNLEDALVSHYTKMLTNQTTEQVGEVSQCISINVCRKNALFNAQTDYTQAVAAEVKGIADEVQNNDASLGLETDHFSAAFVGRFKADVSGVLSESFSLVNEKNNTKQFRTFFTINKQRLGAARASALQTALKETKLTTDQIDAVSKAIDDKFNEDDATKSNAASSDIENEANGD